MESPAPSFPPHSLQPSVASTVLYSPQHYYPQQLVRRRVSRKEANLCCLGCFKCPLKLCAQCIAVYRVLLYLAVIACSLHYLYYNHTARCLLTILPLAVSSISTVLLLLFMRGLSDANEWKMLPFLVAEVVTMVWLALAIIAAWIALVLHCCNLIRIDPPPMREYCSLLGVCQHQHRDNTFLSTMCTAATLLYFIHLPLSLTLHSAYREVQAKLKLREEGGEEEKTMLGWEAKRPYYYSDVVPMESETYGSGEGDNGGESESHKNSENAFRRLGTAIKPTNV